MAEGARVALPYPEVAVVERDTLDGQTEAIAEALRRAASSSNPNRFGRLSRLGAPEDAQEASYLAASAKTRSFLTSAGSTRHLPTIPSTVLYMFHPIGKASRQRARRRNVAMCRSWAMFRERSLTAMCGLS